MKAIAEGGGGGAKRKTEDGIGGALLDGKYLLYCIVLVISF